MRARHGRRKQILPESSSPEREATPQVRTRRQLLGARAKSPGIDHQKSRCGILQLREVVIDRSQRMQRRDRRPESAGRNPRTPGLETVGGQPGDHVAAGYARLCQHALHTADQIEGRGVTHLHRAAAKSRSLRMAGECAQHQLRVRRCVMQPRVVHVGAKHAPKKCRIESRTSSSSRNCSAVLGPRPALAPKSPSRPQ